MRPLLQHRADIGLEGVVKPMLQLTWDFFRLRESIHLLRRLCFFAASEYSELHKGSKLSSKTSKNPSLPFSLKTAEDRKD